RDADRKTGRGVDPRALPTSEAAPPKPTPMVSGESGGLQKAEYLQVAVADRTHAKYLGCGRRKPLWLGSGSCAVPPPAQGCVADRCARCHFGHFFPPRAEHGEPDPW